MELDKPEEYFAVVVCPNCHHEVRRYSTAKEYLPKSRKLNVEISFQCGFCGNYQPKTPVAENSDFIKWIYRKKGGIELKDYHGLSRKDLGLDQPEEGYNVHPDFFDPEREQVKEEIVDDPLGRKHWKDHNMGDDKLV